MSANEYDAILAGQPSQANPYDKIVADGMASSQIALRGSMAAAGTTTPDRAAQVLKLSQRLKLPREIVDRNYDRLSKQYDLSDNEYDSIITENPALSEWLSNPENASIARDDVPTLRRIENTFYSFGRGWSRASSQAKLADLLYKELEQGLTPAEARQRDALKLEQERFSNADKRSGVPEYISGVTGYSARQMGTSLYVGAQGAGAGGAVGAAVGTPLPGVGPARGFVAGATAGALTASAMYSYRMEAGFAFDEFRSLEDLNGNKLDPQVARHAARAVGTINALIESGSGALLASLVPGFDKVIAGLRGDAAKKAVTAQVKAALANPTRRAALMKALGKMGAAGSIEGLEEFMQSLVGAGGREVAQGASGQSFAPDSAADDIAKASREAMDAAIGTFFTFSPVGGTSYFLDARKVDKARQQQEFFTALGTGMQESKTLERLPEKMQEFIERATKDGAIDTVYVPMAPWIEYWQGKGLDPAQVAAEVLGESKAYEQALATGADLAIPMSRYATRLAPTEHNSFLANELRLAPDEMNAREAAEFEKKLASEQKAANEEQKQATVDEGVQQIVENVRSQLVAAGVEESTAQSYAQLQGSMFQSVASRAGVDAKALFERYGLKIGRGALQPGEQALQQEQQNAGLIIQHNLTADNLLHAVKMGGLPVPSLSIAKAEDAPLGFGEITLIGPREMADPRGYASTRVFASDVYSPRYPTVHMKFKDGELKKLGVIIAKHAGLTGRRYFDLDSLSTEGARYLGYHPAVMAEVLEQNGIDLSKVRSEVEAVKRAQSDAYIVDQEIEYRLRQLINDNDLQAKRDEFAEKLIRDMNPEERIFKGFTYSGNRSYTPHTLENVVRILKRELRGGEDLAGIYGIGSARAHFSPQFHSFTAIRKNADRIVSDAAFEAAKKEMEAEFFSLAEGMKAIYRHQPEPFRFYDTVLSLIVDSAKIGLDRALKEYGFDAEPISDEQRQAIYEFTTRLRNMPTQYFEAKILRGVSISEFKAAVVPDDADPEVVRVLLAAGVQVGTYKRNDEAGRKVAIEQMAKRYAETVMFQNSTIDANTGEIVPQPPFYSVLERLIAGAKMERAPAEQWKKYIEGLQNKGVKREEIVMSGVMDWLDLRAKPEEHFGIRYQVVDKDKRVISDFDSQDVAESYVKDVPGTSIVPFKPSDRVTRDELLDYLAQNGVRVEERILGEPRVSARVAANMAADAVPDGYTVGVVRTGARTYYEVRDRFGSVVSNARGTNLFDSRETAVLAANNDALGEGRDSDEISDEAIEELAQRLFEEDLPRLAGEYARESEYVNRTYSVVPVMPNFEIVELPADMLRNNADTDGGASKYGKPRFGVKHLDWGMELGEDAALGDDASAAEREAKGWADDADELKELYPDGPRKAWATTEEFDTEADARAWAEGHTFPDGQQGYDGDMKFIVFDHDDGIKYGEEVADWSDAEKEAQQHRDSNYQHEVESFGENYTYRDFGDRYLNDAREQLEEERDGGHRRGTRDDRDKTGALPVRHKNQWQSKGGRNYRELVLSVPNIEPYNASDSTHFGTDTGGRTVAWARFKIHDDAKGVPTLFIEEVQSQRGQAGEKHGFRRTPSAEERAKLDELKARVDQLRDARIPVLQTANERLSTDFRSVDSFLNMTARAPADDVIEAAGSVEALNSIRDRVIIADQAYHEAIGVYNDAVREYQGGDVPMAPFVADTQAWTALGMKRLVRYAADNGIRQIAWTQGIQNVKRYLNALQERVRTVDWKLREDGKFDLVIHTQSEGDRRVTWEEGEIKAAFSQVGIDIAEMVNSGMTEGTIDRDDIRVNDLGMAGYYGDESGLNPKGKPAIMTIVANRIIKTLGGKQGVKRIDITVQEGENTYEGAPGFEITPEMADRAKGGFSMYQGEKRGRIRISPDRQFSIDLLEGADLSTFIHESGHFWLEVLRDIHGELRAAPAEKLDERQLRMRADFEVLLRWFGVDDPSKIEEKHHEKFARGIEAYLMEGRAPSAELRSIFARVRAWMLSIYRSLTQLNVSLNDEVRGVFDRMLATDEQIAQAEQEASVEALFIDAAKAGMSETEFNAYKGRVEKASATAREELQAKLMQTLTREREAWWRHERRRVRAEIEKDVHARRDVIAYHVLVKDAMPDGSALPYDMQRVKMNREEVDRMLGEGAWKSLPRGSTAQGGIPLATVAEVLGYDSADALLNALRRAEPADAIIERETDERMHAEHGDMLTDGSLVDAARLAVQNEERIAVIQAELKALAKLRRESAPAVKAERARQAEGLDALDRLIPALSAVRSAAKRAIGDKRVRDIKPMQHLIAARRASQAAVEAAAKGEWTFAINAKQRELFNIELYRLAQQAAEEVDETVDYMQKFGEAKVRGRLGKAGQDYLDQIDGFLDRYEFARVPLKTLERRKNLAAWVAEKQRAGEPVTLPEGVELEERVNYKDMTLDELRGVRDSVKHIEHLAKLKNRLLTAKRQKALDEAAEEIASSIESNSKGARPKDIETHLPTKDAGRMVESWFALHRKLASWARELDGFKDGGVFWEYIIRPMNEAGNREADMNAQAIKKLKALFDVYAGAEMRELYVKREVRGAGVSLTKMARLMVALNWGNADNRQKLMDGYGWSAEQVAAILETLDERDWKFVQGMWDFIDSYWPEIAAKEKRINGVAPEKVDASPVMTRFGEMKGGYFPLKYNERLSVRAHRDRIKEMSEMMMREGYGASTTRRGHTKERVEGVKLPVRLDFGVIHEHLAQVVHDITHHEMLLDVNRLLNRKDVQQAIVDHYGDIVYKQMGEAITDIAAGNIPAVGAFERFLQWTRQGTTIVGMGWNVMTSALQPFGLAQSAVRIGPKYVLRGMAKWVSDDMSVQDVVETMLARSEFMRNRMNTQLREINEIRNEIGLNTGKLGGWVDQALRAATLDKVNKHAVADSYFWLIHRAQMIADIPTWLGMHEKALDEGHDDATAIALADQAVLDSQGGGQMKDLAAIQRGGPLLKLWTAFYSYFNVTYNLSVESVKRTNFRDPIQIGRLAVDALLLYTLPATIAAFLRGIVDGDDEDEMTARLIRENIAYAFGVMVGLREAGSMISGVYGYTGPAGTRFFSSVGKLVKQAAQGEFDRALYRAGLDVAGILLHFPAGQVRRSVEGIMVMYEGESQNPMNPIFGPPKEK